MLGSQYKLLLLASCIVHKNKLLNTQYARNSIDGPFFFFPNLYIRLGERLTKGIVIPCKMAADGEQGF